MKSWQAGPSVSRASTRVAGAASCLQLGLADASSSLFSLFAAMLVFQQRASGRALALIVAATQRIVGIGLFLLSGVPLALYFIAMRGAIIGVLAWRLPTVDQSRGASAV